MLYFYRATLSRFRLTLFRDLRLAHPSAYRQAAWRTAFSRAIWTRRAEKPYKAILNDSASSLRPLRLSANALQSDVRDFPTFLPRHVRSFVLQSDGTLSYSRAQGEKTRDSVDLRKASVGRSKKRRHIVIDALDHDSPPWHCKALSDGDFQRLAFPWSFLPPFSLREAEVAAVGNAKDGLQL